MEWPKSGVIRISMVQLPGTNLEHIFKTRVIALANYSKNEMKRVLRAGKTERVRNETIGLDFVSDCLKQAHVRADWLELFARDSPTNEFTLIQRK